MSTLSKLKHKFKIPAKLFVFTLFLSILPVSYCNLNITISGDLLGARDREADHGPTGNCGDGIIDPGEACDDAGATAACDVDCTLPACGDLLVNPFTGETCDDGNALNDDGCSSTCLVEACGDGVVQATEGCDDGNTLSNDGCSSLCVTEFCGDSVTNNGTETCDDGNAVTETCAYGATSCTICNATCQSAAGATSFCGDGAVDGGNGEACDDGNTITETCAYGAPSCTVCNATCQSVAGATTVCGDGAIDGGNGETCDDGNTLNDDGCSSTCLIEACGDGVVQALEGCDDGNTNNGDGCSSLCVTEFCGDSVTNNVTETCDDGNTVTEVCTYGATSCTVCDATCLSVAGATSFCGDGAVDGGNGEACDDGNTITETCAYGAPSCTVCNSTCQSVAGATTVCGDGALDIGNGETCDDGNTLNDDGCSSTCLIEACGDGIVQATEGCDDNNTLSGDGCSSLCVTEFCGDSVTNNVTETCDDGNAVTETCAYGVPSCIVCDATCQSVAGATTFCGDGAIDGGNGETCDDGNTITETCAYGAGPCTVCDATCLSVAGAETFCGDGVINGAEGCDDGNTNNGDGCSATCTPETCTSFFTRDDSTWDASYGIAPTSYANAGAAGGSFSGQATDSSGYQYNFSGMCAGTYYVWVNCFDIGTSTDKSYGYWNFAGDTDPPVAYNMYVYDTFGWKKSNAVALGAGNHTWQFGSMPDQNWFSVGWDQIIVTQNANFAPSPGIVPNPLVTDSLDTFTGWTNNSGGVLVAGPDTTPAVGSGNVKTTGQSGHYLGLKKTFPASQPSYIGVWMRQDTAGTGPYLVAGGANVSNANVVVFVYFTGGNITVSQAAGINLQPYVVGQWYFVEARNINYTTFTMDFYVNGVLRAAGAGFRTNQTSMQEVHFYSLGAGSSYDDLVIY